MFNFNIDPEATYLVACTYGADSMALLDMLLKKGAKPVVVSINYHRFDSTPEDFAGLAGFCKEKGFWPQIYRCGESASGSRKG